MDVSQYLGIFLDESKEHIQSLSDQMMILEQEPENQDAINEIFRAAHSLKGMAGTMGYKRLQRLTHDMEDVFSAVRSGQMKVKSNLMDVLFQALDAIEGYVDTIQNTSDEGDNDNENIIKELNDILKEGTGQSVSEPAEGSKAAEQKPAEEKKAVSAADSEKALYRSVKLEEAQINVMKDAVVAGKHVYAFSVFIQESCLLKAARAFLVFKAIEELGEMVVSSPSAQDIEDEKFELNFSIFVISGEPIDKLKAAILSVSEISDAVGEEYSEDMIDGGNVQSEEETKEETKAAPAAVEQKAAPAVSMAPAPQNQADPKKPANKPVVSRTVRVDIEKLDTLMNLVSELIIAKNTLVSAASNNGSETSGSGSSSPFNEQIEYLESVTTNLHEAVMKVRMVPIESVIQKFPRMVRDLEKKLDKKMSLTMTGEDTELDRTVVDEIGDPLMHLIRNSADHGLEMPAERIQRGKSETGSIFLNAYQDGNNVIIEVGDDGNGIDIEAVRSKIIERNYATEEQAKQMTDKEVIAVLFDPGFSMAKKITDVSGRGVGLDVVKSKIEALGGDVEVKTKLGEGSTFIIRLPLTLAIIQALMVKIGGEKYAISLDSIQTIEDIPNSDIKLVQSKEVIQLRGTVIPIIRLSKVLGIESANSPDANMIVVIAKKGDTLSGLVVDELMGQQEIVIKSLGKYINCSRIISGATILGDGEVALILDANAVI